MGSKSHKVFAALAKAAAMFLVLFILFGLGFMTAQFERVKQVQQYIASGEGEAELLPYAAHPIDNEITVLDASPGALQGGLIFMGPEYSEKIACMLIDARGNIVHRWNVENRLFNPELLKWWKTVPLERGFSIEAARLLPDGDVIFSQQLMSRNVYRGQRLARMDKDSHIRWEVAGNFHHFIEIAGAPQRIYTFESRLREGFPGIAALQKDVRFLEDFITSYSMDGKKLDEWSIPEAFMNSPYANWLSSFEINVPGIQRVVQDDGRALYDLLHPNSLQYLTAEKAKALPFAREGDLLFSLRDLSAVAVLRPETRQIVWAAKGPWRNPHNAHVGDDNKLYIFDNEGRQQVTMYEHSGPPEEKLSRLIRFDPLTNQMEEIYASREMHSFYLGDYYPLDGGAWLMDSPQRGRVFVVSLEGKITWQIRTLPDPVRMTVPAHKMISFVHYHPAGSLPFLDEQKP
jgi:hypothetical protein